MEVVGGLIKGRSTLGMGIGKRRGQKMRWKVRRVGQSFRQITSWLFGQ